MDGAVLPTGRGLKFSIDGKVASSAPWANLSCVGIHPTLAVDSKINPYFLGGGRNEWACLPPAFELEYDNVFEGGAALRFTDSAPITAAAVDAAPTAVYRLFQTDLSLGSPLCVSFTFLGNADDGTPIEDLLEPVLTLHCAGDGEPSTR